MDQLVIVVLRLLPYPGRASYAWLVQSNCIFGAPFACMYRTALNDDVLPDILPEELPYPFQEQANLP